MTETSFLIWKYRFYDDKVDIIRNFFFEKCSCVSTTYLESAAITSNFLLKLFGRCNLTIISSSNNFTLFGIPNAFAQKLCEGFTDSGRERVKIRVTNKDLFKRSLLQSRVIWLVVLMVLIWATVLIFGGRYITAETATTVTDFAFRRTVLFSTLVMSLTLPQAIIWIWAITGGVLVQFIKYFRFTATRTKDVICFEYGLLVYRKVYIPVKRIAVAEYSQTPLMQLFKCGKLRICAIGYNAFFMKSDTILPFVTNSRTRRIITTLLPEFAMKITTAEKSPLRYFLVHWTTLIPIIPLILSLFFGYGWAIVAVIIMAVTFLNAFLLRENSHMVYSEKITYLSRGGMFHKSTLLRNDMIESVSSYGSSRKKRHGLINFSIRVFGKDGHPVRVRNISTQMLDNFPIPKR